MAKKKAKTKSATRRRSASKGFKTTTYFTYLQYALPALGLAAGQFFFFRGHAIVGAALSIASILLIVAFVNGFDLTPKGFSLRIPSLKKVSWKMAAVILGLVLAFLLAAIGQGLVLQRDMGDPSLTKGLWLYAVAIILFLASLWSWNRERLKQEPLSPKLEWTAFGLIMVLALFFRLYKIKDIPAGIFIDEGFA